MDEKLVKYRFSAPQIFTGEMILTYKNGFLNGIEGIKLIGARWDNMCINKAIPFKESDIAAKKEEHANRIYFKPMRGVKAINPNSARQDVRMNGIL